MGLHKTSVKYICRPQNDTRDQLVGFMVKIELVNGHVGQEKGQIMQNIQQKHPDSGKTDLSLCFLAGYLLRTVVVRVETGSLLWGKKRKFVKCEFDANVICPMLIEGRFSEGLLTPIPSPPTPPLPSGVIWLSGLKSPS